MRNILMTVMLLIVVALLFTSVVSNNGGIKDQIKASGDQAINRLIDLNTVSGSGS